MGRGPSHDANSDRPKSLSLQYGGRHSEALALCQTRHCKYFIVLLHFYQFIVRIVYRLSWTYRTSEWEIVTPVPGLRVPWAISSPSFLREPGALIPGRFGCFTAAQSGRAHAANFRWILIRLLFSCSAFMTYENHRFTRCKKKILLSD